jgi:hypothetical protein
MTLFHCHATPLLFRFAFAATPPLRHFATLIHAACHYCRHAAIFAAAAAAAARRLFSHAVIFAIIFAAAILFSFDYFSAAGHMLPYRRTRMMLPRGDTRRARAPAQQAARRARAAQARCSDYFAAFCYFAMMPPPLSGFRHAFIFAAAAAFIFCRDCHAMRRRRHAARLPFSPPASPRRHYAFHATPLLSFSFLPIFQMLPFHAAVMLPPHAMPLRRHAAAAIIFAAMPRRHLPPLPALSLRHSLRRRHAAITLFAATPPFSMPTPAFATPY